jgi:hypothetical protein
MPICRRRVRRLRVRLPIGTAGPNGTPGRHRRRRNRRRTRDSCSVMVETRFDDALTSPASGTIEHGAERHAAERCSGNHAGLVRTAGRRLSVCGSGPRILGVARICCPVRAGTAVQRMDAHARFRRRQASGAHQAAQAASARWRRFFAAS